MSFRLGVGLVFIALIFLRVADRVWDVNASNPIQGDESQIVFAAVHPPASNCLRMVSYGTFSMMPWGYNELSVYLRVVQGISKAWLFESVESVLRLPLLFYGLVTVGSLFLTLWTLSGSVFFSLALVGYFFCFSSMGLGFLTEYRYHSVWPAWSGLSWLFLVLFLRARLRMPPSGKWSWLWFLGYVFCSVPASWTHLYGLANVALQVGVLFWVSYRWKAWSTAFAAIPGLISCLWAFAYFLKVPTKPPLRPISYSELPAGIVSTMNELGVHLYGSWLFWVGGFFFLLWVGPRSRGEKILMSFVGLSLWASMLTLAYLFWANQYSEHSELIARYSAGPLVPLLLLSALAFPRFSGLNSWLDLVLATVVFGVFLFKKIDVKPFVTQNPWTSVKSVVHRHNLHGKIHVVAGIDVKSRDQDKLNKIFMGQAYRIYISSPFPKFSNPDASCFYGNVDEVLSCEEASRFPLYREVSPDQYEPVLDLCNPLFFEIRARDRAMHS